MKKIGLFVIALLVSISGCSKNNNSEKQSALLAAVAAALSGGAEGHSWPLMSSVNTAQPSSTVKLVFMHHSTGFAWLATDNGNLGQELNANNYYVTETDYGWGPASADYGGDVIGNHTDTFDWPNWFNNSTVMTQLYSNSLNSAYTNDVAVTEPGGDNEIIMFKSCFPNSEVGDSIDDEQALYNGLLTYFGAHTDKMFVLIVPPPEINIDTPALTRELANWLVASDGWLAGYGGGIVFVFDYYNVLTDPNNHHYVNGTTVEHIVRQGSSNELRYYHGNDSHPTASGHQKATAEFVPLLNAYYNVWKP